LVVVVAGEDEMVVSIQPGAVIECAEVAGVGAVGPELKEAGGVEKGVFSIGGAGAVGEEPEFGKGVYEKGAAGSGGEHYENKGV
jgi:hypothetical protein